MKLFYVLLLLGSIINSSAQQFESVIVSSGGGQISGNNLILDWTIGEPIIDRINNDQILLSQGFHHSSKKESIELYSISGNVWEGSNLLTNGEIKLFLANASEKFPPIYSLNISEGEFSLPFIPQSDYVIYAIPNNLDNYYPTYYVKAIQREDAYVLELEYNTGNIDIQLVPKYTDMQNPSIGNNIDVLLYPNPVSDYLTIKLMGKSNENMVVDLIDLSGKLLMQKSFKNTQQTKIDLSSFNQGIYMIKILAGKTATNRLIIKK